MTEIKQVPKLRFGCFDGEWEKIYLDNIATFSKGKGISKNDIYDEGIDCIRYGELYTDYKEIIHTIKSKTNLNKNELILSEKNDILIPCSGETAIDLATASCIQKNDVAIGSDITIFKTNQYAPFITYYLNQKRNEIAKYAQGVSIVHLYPKDFKSISFRIPSIKEQKKIASFIFIIDQKINLLNQKLSNLKDFKKYLMQQIFIHKLRFVNCEYKIGKLKDYLIESKISGIDDINKRLTVKLNLKGICPREVKTTEIEGATKQFIRKAGQFIYGKQNLHKGAFGIVPKELDGYLSSSDIPSFDFIDENIIPKWFFYYFSRKNFYEKLENLSTGTGSKRISPKEFLNINIMIPEIEEQKKIANFLSSVDQKIELINQQLKQTTKFKQFLLQHLFV